jgi:hypothetical protein
VIVDTSGDVYVDEPWLYMRWDSQSRSVIAEWKGFATNKEFQGAMTKAIDVHRERQAVCFVNDTRHMELVSDEDQRWIRYTWAPMAIKAGVKRIAVVLAKHGLSRMAIQGMFAGRRNTAEQLDSRTFDSLDEAMEWATGLKQTKAL